MSKAISQMTDDQRKVFFDSTFQLEYETPIKSVYVSLLFEASKAVFDLYECDALTTADMEKLTDEQAKLVDYALHRLRMIEEMFSNARSVEMEMC